MGGLDEPQSLKCIVASLAFADFSACAARFPPVGSAFWMPELCSRFVSLLRAQRTENSGFFSRPWKFLQLQENNKQNQMTKAWGGFSCRRAARRPCPVWLSSACPWQGRSTKRRFRTRLRFGGFGRHVGLGAAQPPGGEQLPREDGSSCPSRMSHSGKKWV